MNTEGISLRQRMLVSGMDIAHIARRIKVMEGGRQQSGNTSLLSEALQEIGICVFRGAIFFYSCRDKAELNREIEKAKQQSLERCESLFKTMEQSSGDSLRPMQSDKVKQLVAKHREELMKMEKKIENLKTGHKAELERFRAEAEQKTSARNEGAI